MFWKNFKNMKIEKTSKNIQKIKKSKKQKLKRPLPRRLFFLEKCYKKSCSKWGHKNSDFEHPGKEKERENGKRKNKKRKKRKEKKKKEKMMGDTLTVVFTWAKWMVTKLNRKSLRAQREVGSTQCTRKESGSRVSRPQCPSVCHQFTSPPRAHVERPLELFGCQQNLRQLNSHNFHPLCMWHRLAVICYGFVFLWDFSLLCPEVLHVNMLRFARSRAVDQAHRCWGVQVQIQSAGHSQVLGHALDPEPFWGRLDCSKKLTFGRRQRHHLLFLGPHFETAASPHDDSSWDRPSSGSVASPVSIRVGLQVTTLLPEEPALRSCRRGTCQFSWRIPCPASMVVPSHSMRTWGLDGLVTGNWFVQRLLGPPVSAWLAMAVAPCTFFPKNRSLSRYQASPAVLEVSTIPRAILAVSLFPLLHLCC